MRNNTKEIYRQKKYRVGESIRVNQHRPPGTVTAAGIRNHSSRSLLHITCPVSNEFLQTNQTFSETACVIGSSFGSPHVTPPNRYRFYTCIFVEEQIKPTGESGTIRLRKGKQAVYALKGCRSGLQKACNYISFPSIPSPVMERPLRIGKRFRKNRQQRFIYR